MIYGFIYIIHYLLSIIHYYAFMQVIFHHHSILLDYSIMNTHCIHQRQQSIFLPNSQIQACLPIYNHFSLAQSAPQSVSVSISASNISVSTSVHKSSPTHLLGHAMTFPFLAFISHHFHNICHDHTLPFL